MDSTVKATASARSFERLRWLLLSAAPASLMLSVTTYASTDIAAVPLLWIVPLALYLLTFVLAFAQRQVLPGWIAGGLLPLLALPCAFAMVTETTRPLGFVLPLHVVTFFVAAISCHAQLAQSRPAVSRLTEFYLWIALGGAVGGLFNVLVAPLIFVRTYEYPLALVLACLLRPTPNAGSTASGGWPMDVGFALVPGLALVGLVFSARFSALAPTLGSKVLVVSLPLLICLGLWPWPRRFALGLVGIFIAAPYGIVGDPVLLAERGFFGEHKVIERAGQHVLMHGTTNHGAQWWTETRRRFVPTTYYGTTSPIGQMVWEVDRPEDASIGVIGLGTAGLAAYARPKERWTFFELNPAVARLARDPRLFTMLEREGLDERVVIGDARLSLSASADKYDLLIVDAFSSDAIPVHLITREALSVYLQHLKPQGALAFHVSNRYLDLRPVLANLATAEGLVALTSTHVLTNQDQADGLLVSTWVALARSDADLGPLVGDARWLRLHGDTSAAWTDDFSNIWSVFHW